MIEHYGMNYRQIAETFKLSLSTVYYIHRRFKQLGGQMVDFMHRSGRPLKDTTVKVLELIRDPALL